MKERTQEQILKRVLRKAYNKGLPREIKSLTEESRYAYDDNYDDYYKEFGFFPSYVEKWTDAEIKEWIDEEVWERIFSPYDCTGKRFTCWISWHRNPNGKISFVHRFGIDV